MTSTKSSYSYELLRNVHCDVKPPTKGLSLLTQADFAYYHYGCDGFFDVGWGCAYRTLQSMISSLLHQNKTFRDVPSIKCIQQTLVNVGDKPKSFVDSREWIGAIEVSYVLDALHNVSCKILHVTNNDNLRDFAQQIKAYFETSAGLIMMGGDVDASSKGIAGYHESCTGDDVHLLVIDPHFVGIPCGVDELISRGYIRWHHISNFIDSSMYNLCLPELKH